MKYVIFSANFGVQNRFDFITYNLTRKPREKNNNLHTTNGHWRCFIHCLQAL